MVERTVSKLVHAARLAAALGYLVIREGDPADCLYLVAAGRLRVVKAGAAEMREVAATQEEVGLAPTMAAATAVRHDALVREMAEAGIAYPADGAFSWRALADALAAAEHPTESTK